MKSVLDRILGLFRTRPQATPANDASYDSLEVLNEYVRRDVAAGFYDREQILQNAEDAFSDGVEVSKLRAEAKWVLERALSARAIEQQSWPDVTDCDRLDAAFADLEAEEIIARQNFSCSGTCGSHEIWDEADAEQAKGKTVRGHTFYHMQDTESATDGDGLYLNYGAADDGEDAAVEIGHRIVEQADSCGARLETTKLATSLRTFRKIGKSGDQSPLAQIVGQNRSIDEMMRLPAAGARRGDVVGIVVDE
jgi:hypothetical protein